jgi:hypothetical protein
MSISTSSASGSTATVAAEVWMRPGPRSRHALDAVHAALELQPAEHAVAGDRGDDLLVAAHLAFGDAVDLDLPALQRRVALVHAEQVAGEQRGLVAAGAGADFEDGRSVLVLVLEGPASGPTRAPSAAASRPAPGSRRRAMAAISASPGHLLQLGALGAQPWPGPGPPRPPGAARRAPWTGDDLGPSVAAPMRASISEAVENLVEAGLG